jgi:hypothetical protein
MTNSFNVLTIKKNFVEYWIFSFHPSKKLKAQNMISLMLDPRFKKLCIISSFVGRGKRCCSRI